MQSAGLNSFNDSKFKEAIVLPDNVSGDALGHQGAILPKTQMGCHLPAIKIGLLSDGSGLFLRLYCCFW